MIRQAKEGDLKELAKVYKEVFKVHNVFEKSEEEVESYLKKFLGSLLVAEEDGKVVGGVAIVEKKQNPEWSLFSLKHIAVSPAYQDHDIGTALLEEAEKTAGKGKVEINIGERESGSLRFYEKNGYQKEGILKSHYRKGESCIVMGKVLG